MLRLRRALIYSSTIKVHSDRVHTWLPFLGQVRLGQAKAGSTFIGHLVQIILQCWGSQGEKPSKLAVGCLCPDRLQVGGVYGPKGLQTVCGPSTLTAHLHIQSLDELPEITANIGDTLKKGPIFLMRPSSNNTLPDTANEHSRPHQKY